MSPEQFKAELKARIESGISRVVIIEGSPGIGKTQIPAQVAKELDIAFHCIHAPLLQPEDYGFPVISADKSNVSFIVSKDKFPVEGSSFPDKGILLIDELPQCGMSEQKILANFIQTKEIHGQYLKKGWTIVVTGNRSTDRAGANRLLTHLSNRMTRLALDVSLDDWTNWALDNGVKTEVISFIRFRPELLNQFDAQLDVNATPRAWVEGVNASLGITKNEFEVFKGDIGEGATAEFLAFLKIYRQLPSIDSILLNPDKHELPKDAAVKYALTGALAHKTTKDNFNRVMMFMRRMSPEFQVLYIRDATRRDQGLCATKEFIDWASKEGKGLLT